MNAKKDITNPGAGQQHNTSVTGITTLKHCPVINSNSRKKIQETISELTYRRQLFAGKGSRQKTNSSRVIFYKLKSNFISSILAGPEKLSRYTCHDSIRYYEIILRRKFFINTQNFTIIIS